MNTSKDQLEWKIKKQIEEREMEPSRDLWNEIELHTGTANHPKPRINWFLAAACLALVLSLGTLLFFFQEPSIEQGPRPQIAKEAEKPVTGKKVAQPESNEKPLVVQNNENKAVKEASHQDIEQNIVAVEKKIEPKDYILEKKPAALPYDAKIIAQADTLKVPVKKKKYVDPEILLFSVEHKDVIEKTKESNVATVDLNGK